MTMALHWPPKTKRPAQVLQSRNHEDWCHGQHSVALSLTSGLAKVTEVTGVTEVPGLNSDWERSDVP